MNGKDLENIIEAVLFVAGDPVGISDLAAALEADPLEVSRAADEMARKRKEQGSGIQVLRLGDSLQLCSNADYSGYIEKALRPVKKTRLSQSLLETLAIVAYKQPITRFEIEQIRGVKCNYSVAALIESGLIVRAGRKKALGNPMLYATGDEFLRHFGISSLEELPALPEIREDGA